jgi:hypothetical protein
MKPKRGQLLRPWQITCEVIGPDGAEQSFIKVWQVGTEVHMKLYEDSREIKLGIAGTDTLTNCLFSAQRRAVDHVRREAS